MLFGAWGGAVSENPPPHLALGTGPVWQLCWLGAQTQGWLVLLSVILESLGQLEVIEVKAFKADVDGIKTRSFFSTIEPEDSSRRILAFLFSFSTSSSCRSGLIEKEQTIAIPPIQATTIINCRLYFASLVNMQDIKGPTVEQIESSPATIMEAPAKNLDGTVQLVSDQGVILIPTPSADPRDPLNIPLWQKLVILGTTCLCKLNRCLC